MLQQVPLSLTTGSTSNRSGESMGRIVSGPFSYRNADYSLLEMFRLIRFGLSRILKPGGRLLRLYGRPESPSPIATTQQRSAKFLAIVAGVLGKAWDRRGGCAVQRIRGCHRSRRRNGRSRLSSEVQGISG